VIFDFSLSHYERTSSLDSGSSTKSSPYAPADTSEVMIPRFCQAFIAAQVWNFEESNKDASIPVEEPR
jgi:hypothetical protein